MPILVNMPSLDPADVIKAKNDIETIKNDKADKTQLSNPNLLINPDFRINQRGQSEYTASSSTIYTVDRWKTTNGNLTISPLTEDNKTYINLLHNGAGVSTGYGYFRQEFENPLMGTYTVSAYVRGTGKFNINILGRTSDGTVVTANLITADATSEWVRYTSTFTTESKLNTSLSQVYFRIYEGANIDVADVKLELGSVATEFVPPDPASELLKCQRYCTMIDRWERFRAVSITENLIEFSIPISTSMYAAPTIINSEAFVVRDIKKQAHTGFSFSISNSATGRGILIIASKTSHGLTDAQLVVDTQRILLSADL